MDTQPPGEVLAYKNTDRDRIKHYNDVIYSLKIGRLIFFLGAGVNLCGRDRSKRFVPGKVLPSGVELAEYLAEEAKFLDLSIPVIEPLRNFLKTQAEFPEASISATESLRNFLIDKANLSDASVSAVIDLLNLLKKKFPEAPASAIMYLFDFLRAEFPDSSLPEIMHLLDLLVVAQYLFIDRDELRLYDVLHDLFDRDYEPSPVHTWLAQLPVVLMSKGCQKPHQLIVTTNYDDLMERAFDAHNEPYDLVFYDARMKSPHRGKFWHRPPGGEPEQILEPNNFSLPLDQHSVVFKIASSAESVGGKAAG